MKIVWAGDFVQQTKMFSFLFFNCHQQTTVRLVLALKVTCTCNWF